jgi:hypothetical protein
LSRAIIALCLGKPPDIAQIPATPKPSSRNLNCRTARSRLEGRQFYCERFAGDFGNRLSFGNFGASCFDFGLTAIFRVRPLVVTDSFFAGFLFCLFFCTFTCCPPSVAVCTYPAFFTMTRREYRRRSRICTIVAPISTMAHREAETCLFQAVLCLSKSQGAGSENRSESK